METEIDFFVIFMTAFKRYKLIFVIVLISMAGAFFLTPLPELSYHAVATVGIAPFKPNDVILKTELLLDAGKNAEEQKSLAALLSIPVKTYELFAKSGDVLENTVKVFNSRNKTGQPLTVGTLSAAISVTTDKNSDKFYMSVIDSDSRRAKAMADIWVASYIDYVHKMTIGEKQSVEIYIQEELESGQKKLADIIVKLNEFETAGQLSFLKAKLKDEQSRLESSWHDLFLLGHKIEEKERELRKAEDSYRLFLMDGVWVGSFDSTRLCNMDKINNTFTQEQMALRERLVKVVCALEECQRRKDTFMNESGIELLRERIRSLQNDIVQNRNILYKMMFFSGVTEKDLADDRKTVKNNGMRLILPDSISDFSFWSVMALKENYNFFDTRRDFLKRLTDGQEAELRILKEKLSKSEWGLRVLDEELKRVKNIYSLYLEKFERLNTEINSLILELSDLKSRFSIMKESADQLLKDTAETRHYVQEKENVLMTLKRKKSLYENICVLLAGKTHFKEAQLKEVFIVSPAASTPVFMTKQSRKRNVIIAGAVSFCFALVVAFFLEIFAKDGKKKVANLISQVGIRK